MFRSVPLALLAPLLAAPGLEVFLVQTDIRAGDDAVVAAHPGVVDLRRELGDLADTAAVLERMDLVISVDSAVAHLAGALGRPLWVLLPFMADWRWLEERTDSPWYPTARLFRQPGFGDWAPVVGAVQAALRAG
jgi:ADP-heptose:LPS heptosyltransferase